MPQEALPVPHNPALRELHTVHREFRDLLQRPLSGTLTLRGEEATSEGGTVVAAAEVKVSVFEGVLSLPLPPGDYTLSGTLFTKDDSSISVMEIFTVGEEGEDDMGGKPNPGTKPDKRLKENRKGKKRK